MNTIRAEKVNFRSIRINGSNEDHHLLARRMFEVLHPLYAQLANEHYTHFLEKFVLDSTSNTFNGFFLIDQANRDVGLTAVRITEASYNGQVVAHLTIHLGLHPDSRGEKHTRSLIFKEIFKYKFRYPFRPFFIIDTPVSAASYRKLAKGTAIFYPTPDHAIPDSLWVLCESVAKAKGWQPIEGAPREARFVERPLTDLSRTDPRQASEEFKSIERWFSKTTLGVPGSGILIIVPITWRNIIFSIFKIIGPRSAFSKNVSKSQ